MQKEYSILSNWKYVFREMVSYDRKYPFYIGIKSATAFLGPFVAAVIPSVAIALVEKRTDFFTFFCVMAVFVLGNLVMGLISTKMEFVIKEKNFFVAYRPVQQKAIAKILDVDYAILESSEGKRLADNAKYSYELDWQGWNRIMDMFTPFAYNLLGIVVYTIILLPKCPWVLPVFAVMSVMNIFMEKTISVRGWRKHRDVIFETDSRMNYFFQRSTSATEGKDIRLYQMEQWFCSLMEALVKRRMYVWKRVEVAYFVPNLSDTVWTLLRDIIAYSILVGSFMKGNLDAASFTLYLGIITGFAGWLNGGNMGDGFVRANSEMMRCCWSINSYRSFMELWSPYEEESPVEKRAWKTSEKKRAGVSQKEMAEVRKTLSEENEQGAKIEFRDVCFRYPGAEKDVVHHLNLTIRPGENIALVGVNGAGKTTLVKLLCGFYHPDSGEILVNGRDIREYSALEYRKLLGAVFQDMMIMATTVAENIACCREEDIDEERLWNAIRLADMEEKLRGLPKKEKTSVTNFLDKDGVLFSGGELQRLLLARALYKDAPILLLDEPTSALDPLAETAVYEKYHSLSRGKTTLFISHRLASTRFCDRILFYEDGQIKEDGTHQELMEKRGAYEEMFSIQSQYYQEGGDGDE